jgi:diguanylate cyclase (GGDEF)-like protein
MWTLRQFLLTVGLCVCLLLPVSAAAADTVAERLAQADDIKRKDFAAFSAALEALEREPGLTPAEREHLAYLQGWRAIYTLDYDVALQRLDALIGTATSSVIRQRASASRINVLTLSRRYEEAFSGLNTLLERLPAMDDAVAREQLFGIAAMLLVDVAEYEQAIQYATQMREARQSPWARCASAMMILEARLGQEALRADDSRFADTIRDCEAVGEPLPAGLARSMLAGLQLQDGRAAELLPRLEAEFGQVRATAYPRLVAEYQALLAAASLQLGRLAEARAYAEAALEAGRGQQTKPQVDALRLLYRIERAAGDLPAAIDWLERYHEARRQLLDDVGVRQMAYQRVRSEAIANQMQIEALNRQNQLLAIEQKWKNTSLENARLYLALVLLILTAVLLGAWRIWRIQRQFQLRAENDGLTGIANRAHFLAVAEQRLKQAERAGQLVALLIIDLDHFKAVNDTWGHPAGDQVLKRATAAWVAVLKPGEWFGRLGGEEFALLLTGVTPSEARSRADALRTALSRERVELGGRMIGITASFGVATNADGVYAIKQLLIRADAAMYRAKQEGRDRVVAWAA